MDVDESKQNGNAKREKNDLKSKIKKIDSINLDNKGTNRKKRKKSVSNHADVQAKNPKSDIQSNDEVVDDTEVTGNEDGPKKEPKTPSKRQLKKEKADKRIAEKKEASKLEAAQRAITYVSKWKHAKNDWKFEKLRQIWLMDNLLDGDLVPDTVFPIALEYFEGCKGMARQQLVKKMMDVIRKVEEERSNEEEESEKTDTVEYLRARQVLQALPTEA